MDTSITEGATAAAAAADRPVSMVEETLLSLVQFVMLDECCTSIVSLSISVMEGSVSLLLF